MSDDPYKAPEKQTVPSNWRTSNLRFWLYFFVFGVGGLLLTLATWFAVMNLIILNNID